MKATKRIAIYPKLELQIHEDTTSLPILMSQLTPFYCQQQLQHQIQVPQ